MWFKVDDAFWSHPKVIGLSSSAVALWTLAGSWAGQQGTAGSVPEAMLPLLRGNAKAAAELVQAGLWDTSDGGWRFHDWHVYNFDAATVQERKARQSAAGVEANHVRWHVGTGRKSDSCPLCLDARSESESDRYPESDRTPPVPSRPDPTQIDDGDTHKPGTKVDARDEDPVLEGFQSLGFTSPAARGRVLAAVRNALPFGVVSDAEVVDVARVLLSASTTHVRYPASYVERACESPADVVRVWESLPNVVA